MSAGAKPTVYEAWSHVMAAVQSVGKTGFNEQQKYPFRGIDAVVNAAGPALREHGVMVMPSLLDASYRDVEVGAKRTLMRETTVEVRYTIIGPAGDALVVPDDPKFGVVPGESLDSGDKGTAKAMSVAYRIFLLQALTIPTGDHDPDSASYERSARSDEPTVPAASKEQVDRVKAMAANLDDEQWRQVQAWTKQKHLPEPDRLTAPQADEVIAYIAALAAPVEGDTPPSPSTPGAYTQMTDKAKTIADEAPEVAP